jgi:hypothetical protein
LSAARASTFQPASQRSSVGREATAAATAETAAWARSPRAGITKASGSASTSSGSGRSISSAQFISSSPTPCPTEPIISAARACAEAPDAVAAVQSSEAISQLRGLGQPRPAVVPSSGMFTVNAGRAETKAETRPRPSGSWVSQSSGSRGTGGDCHPPLSPSAKACASTGQSR